MIQLTPYINTHTCLSIYEYLNNMTIDSKSSIFRIETLVMITDNVSRYDLPEYVKIGNEGKSQADSNNENRLRQCECSIPER